jgi:hypothetical protein
MEKVIYPLWKPEGVTAESFSQSLLGSFAEDVLQDPGIRGLRLCVVDQQVEAAEPYRMVNLFEQAFDAVLLVWFDSSTRREHLETTLAGYCATWHAYLVTEAEQIPPTGPPATPGQRIEGMNEIVFLQRPPRLSRDEWLAIWQGSHTDIAIETQSTFGYRQNVVVRPLSEGGPVIDAIIEENFPERAIGSRMAFYDAENDPELYRQREQIMIESCARFIDFDKLDCIPTSEYVLKCLSD